ncbi:MAG: energy-coupling factor ABC transporter ATP-binding protein [Firmicutes bacterium]|nr:energy-coupling factor ABC transporter ATP-binding protein [Bacillota bacterium]MCL5040244.1 energy-coupling factor ABC transporter ATP-binding protein [Bacillota bacterium]
MEKSRAKEIGTEGIDPEEIQVREIARVDCLTHLYPDQTRVEICGLSFVLRPGEKAVIVGPNGSGKTTLLWHLIGLLTPVQGEVRVFGLNPAQNLRRLVRRLGVVLQNVDEQIIGPTVRDDVAIALRSLGWPRSEVEKRVLAVLQSMGIAHLADRIPHYLSGGERKKVALAGALVTEPELLILDEPYAGLDPAARVEITQILSEYNRMHGSAIVMATHELELVPQLADTIYVMSEGRILARGRPEDILQQDGLLQSIQLRNEWIPRRVTVH